MLQFRNVLKLSIVLTTILLFKLCSCSTGHLEAAKVPVKTDVVTKFLKTVQVNGPLVHGNDHGVAKKMEDRYLSPESVKEMKNFNLDELEEIELQPLATPFHEWVLNKVKDADPATSFQRGPGGLVETPIGDISLGCYNDTIRLVEDATNGVDYAVKLSASFASYTYFFERYEFTGQWRFPGDFDLCAEVRKDNKDSPSPMDSKYCLQNMAGLQAGTCWSVRCSDDDIFEMSITYLGMVLGLLLFPYVLCETDVEWFGGSIATVSVISVFAFIVVIGTTYHLTVHRLVKKNLKKAKDDTKRNLPPDETKHNGAAYGQHVDDKLSGSVETKIDDETKITTDHKHDYGTVPTGENVIYEPSEALKADFVVQQDGAYSGKDKIVAVKQEKKSSYGLAYLDRLILSTSAILNTEKFMDCTVNSPTTLCLNGLRTLSMFWIILGHTALFTAQDRIDNMWYFYGLAEKLTTKAVTESPFGVDTFFFLSGLLVAYLTLKQLAKNNGSINWGLFYLHRFWRITPVYMVTLAVWATLLLQWGQGPNHNAVGTYLSGMCSELWWTHFLYINNLYPFPGSVNESCMGWSWYLANDMQFFIISPVLLIILYKSWKWGVGTIVGMCLVSLAATIYLTIHWGLGFGNTGFYNNATIEDTRGGDDYIYGKPYHRIPSYLIGILFGYMLYKLKGRQIKMKWWLCLAGWSLASFTGLAVVYGPFWFSEPGTPQWVSVVYNTLSRPSFTLAVAWVAFACIMGYGGLINRFLSWTVWIPLGRLTFGAYLVHPIIMEWYLLTTKTMYHASPTTMSMLYVGFIVFAYAVAFVLALLVEGPTAGLEEILIGKWRRGQAPSPCSSRKSREST